MAAKRKPAKAKPRAKVKTAPKAKPKPSKPARRFAPGPPIDVVTQVLDACPLGVAISTVGEAKIVYTNDAMAAMFGVSPAAALGRHVASFYSDIADREYVRDTLAAKGEIHKYAMRGKTATGGERMSRLSARVITYRGAPAILSWMED